MARTGHAGDQGLVSVRLSGRGVPECDSSGSKQVILGAGLPKLADADRSSPPRLRASAGRASVD